jgi:4a-hydroxytetrahydrobiopterin dehydratase
MSLAEEKCRTPRSDDRPLTPDETFQLVQETPLWSVKDQTLERQWKFKDFRKAMAFVDRVADLAEQENHHPDIGISYNTVRLVLATHKIHGLSLNDFILAAKIDRLEA